ncbi:MAG: hypothetical protein ACP5NP_05345 [Acetobacteraceae bacterium]
MSDEILAAWIQGGCTLAAGAVALVGGFLAYIGAVNAAKCQVRLAESNYKAQASAYRTRMIEIAVKLCDMAFVNDRYLKGNPDSIRIEMFSIPEELSPSNWRDHAMLGDEAVTAISNVYEMAKRFEKFARKMRDKPASANSEAFGDDRAIDTYRHLIQAQRDRAKKLLTVSKSQMTVA